MAIMQMVVVACLGMKNAPGRSAVKPQKDSSKNVLSQRGLIRGKGKMVIFLVCQTIVKMIPKVWARRDEEVGIGIT